MPAAELLGRYHVNIMEDTELDDTALDVSSASTTIRSALTRGLWVALFVWPLSAASQSVPLGAEAFTAFMAELIRGSGDAAVEVTIPSPLVVKLKAVSGI